VISVTFPDPCKRLSMNDRMHWARRAGITSKWRQAAHMYARQQGRTGELGPSNVKVTFEVPDAGRRRDPSNAMPTVKALVDGLVDAGMWPDDNSDWVTIIEPAFVKGAGRTRIDIWPREATP
jgi:crossover junction endodeoxyribonuclease RusA